MYDIVERIKLQEARKKNLELLKLKYSDTDLNPVLSKRTIDYHYHSLAKAYVDRYNKNEGDRDFNYAGVFLHNIWFDQFREVRVINKPNGPIASFIEKHYGTYGEFQDKFQEEALKIQGSGWIYLANNGSIKTIVNHDVRDDILLLVDWWEHAFILDYGSDKKEYLKQLWKIIDWNKISTRWGKSL